MRFSLILCLAAAPVWAGDGYCSAPETQSEMNRCAYEAWQASDAELNAVYKLAIARAKEMDNGISLRRRVGPAVMAQDSTEEALVQAQRAWIQYRDFACIADSDVVRGGTMQPLLFSSCARSITEERTDQLREFVDFPQ